MRIPVSALATVRGLVTPMLLGAALVAFGGDAAATVSSSNPECSGNVSSTTLDPTATSTSFAAGSLIIPMDTEETKKLKATSGH